MSIWSEEAKEGQRLWGEEMFSNAMASDLQCRKVLETLQGKTCCKLSPAPFIPCVFRGYFVCSFSNIFKKGEPT